MMRKEKIEVFGKDSYLLGKTKDGEKIYLIEASFDCKWYWGIGYIESFNRFKTDINCHMHFNSLFFNGKKCGYDLFKEYFSETTLTDNEIWKLLELMKTLYTMRVYSDTLYRGSSHYTNNPCNDIIKNDDEYNRINKIVIPELLKNVYSLLSEEA